MFFSFGYLPWCQSNICSMDVMHTLIFKAFFMRICKKGLFYEEEDVILCCVAGHDFYKSSKQKKRTLDLTDTCV
jgi:hypothetical protein